MNFSRSCLEEERRDRQTLEFDPRHSSSREFDDEYTTFKLKELKTLFPKTGMAHVWNITDDPPDPVSEEVVEPSPNLHEQMMAMVFSPDNVPPVSIDMALVNYIETNTVGQRLCETWTKLHRGRVTSSLFGDVLKARNKPVSLIQQIMEGSNMDRYASKPPAVQWGMVNEENARKEYRSTFQFHVEETGLTLSPLYTFMGASSDGRVMDHTMPEDRKFGVLEIKCPYSIKGKIINNLTGIELLSQPGFFMKMENSSPQLDRNHKYYAQCQGEMAIMGLPWCDFFVWTNANNDNFLCERILFDAEFVTNMLQKVVEFYMQHIYPLVMGQN